MYKVHFFIHNYKNNLYNLPSFTVYKQKAFYLHKIKQNFTSAKLKVSKRELHSFDHIALLSLNFRKCKRKVVNFINKNQKF